MKTRDIYIILMDTGSFVGKIVSHATRYKYSHVALSMDNTFDKLYSFGRKKINNFLNGGFVTYGKNSDFFKKFKNTKCLIYKLEIPVSKYNKLSKLLFDFENESNKYKYDIKGLLIRYFFDKNITRENYYVCSMFVADMLQKADIYTFNNKIEYVRPEDFNVIPNSIKIFEGLFISYR